MDPHFYASVVVIIYTWRWTKNYTAVHGGHTRNGIGLNLRIEYLMLVA